MAPVGQDRLGRPRAGRRVAQRAVTLVLGPLVLAGCGLGNPPQADMAITNDTDEPLAINEQTSPPRYTIDPGETHGFSLGGYEGDCTPWTLHATTTDGVEASTVGEPLCDGDHWTITQDELDAARQEAGTPAPTPTP
ncbi:MAG: hypothetical protein IE923_09880 [Micrococcales bacterium]|nr:hypothetical protein [Micrococcales bacterium]